MTERWTTRIARRPLLAGLLGALGLGIAGGLVYEVPRLMRRRYPRTKFDDLLSRLDDRDSAARLGSAVLAENPRFNAEAAATGLRRKIGRGTFRRAVEEDVARGRLVEVHGWLVPETVSAVAGIAARVQ